MAEGPKLVLTEPMLTRAREQYAATGDMRDAIEAAFSDLPLTNYAVGIALQFFDLVICVKDGAGGAAAAGVYRSDNPEVAIDSLGHTIDVSWGEGPPRYIKRVAIGDLRAPEASP